MRPHPRLGPAGGRRKTVAVTDTPTLKSDLERLIDPR